MSQAPSVDVTRTQSEPEISLGRELRRAREVRGISIEQISQETKISERYLLALEADRLDLLPGPLYARNFVRAFARAIGADEEELLDYFNYQQRLTQDVEATREEVRTAQATRRGAVVAVVVVAGIALIAALTMLVRDRAPSTTAAPATRPQRLGQPAATAPAAAAPSETPVAPAPAPAADASPAEGASDAPATMATPASATAARPVPPVLAAAAAAAAAPAAAPAGATSAAATPAAATPAAAETPAPKLQISFTDSSWVEIQRQGEAEPILGMKKKGATMTYTLDKPITLTFLNSAGASLSVDGQPFKPLGAPQEKRTLTIDRTNYQQYLKK